MTGKVSLANDQPVSGGTVFLYRKAEDEEEDERPTQGEEGENDGIGTIDQDGRFEITTGQFQGAAPGAYRVVIKPKSKEDSTRIPKKYQQLGTTDLEVQIEPKENDLKLVLSP